MYKLGIFLLSLSGLAGAQYVVSARAGSIQFVTGNVYVDGQRLQKAPLSFLVLNDQQVLRTGRGRVEVLLAPGVFLRLGQQSALRMLDNRLENAVLGVEKGRAAGRNRRVSLRGTVAVSAFRRGNVDAL